VESALVGALSAHQWGVKQYRVDIDIAQEPRDLVAQLAPSISLIIRQEHDPCCPGRQRIAAVWVLAQARETLPEASVSPLPAPKEVPVTREAQEALER
jgi:hypothetical protein